MSDDPLLCDVPPQWSFYSLMWFWGWLGLARWLFLSFFHGGGDWNHWQAFPVTSLTTNPGCKWPVSWNPCGVPSHGLHISQFWEQASQGTVREGTNFIKSGPRDLDSITPPTLPVSHQPPSKRMRPIGLIQLLVRGLKKYLVVRLWNHQSWQPLQTISLCLFSLLTQI